MIKKEKKKKSKNCHAPSFPDFLSSQPIVAFITVRTPPKRTPNHYNTELKCEWGDERVKEDEKCEERRLYPMLMPSHRVKI